MKNVSMKAFICVRLPSILVSSALAYYLYYPCIVVNQCYRSKHRDELKLPTTLLATSSHPCSRNIDYVYVCACLCNPYRHMGMIHFRSAQARTHTTRCKHADIYISMLPVSHTPLGRRGRREFRNRLFKLLYNL